MIYMLLCQQKIEINYGLKRRQKKFLWKVFPTKSERRGKKKPTKRLTRSTKRPKQWLSAEVHAF